MGHRNACVCTGGLSCSYRIGVIDGAAEDAGLHENRRGIMIVDNSCPLLSSQSPYIPVSQATDGGDGSTLNELARCCHRLVSAAVRDS